MSFRYCPLCAFPWNRIGGRDEEKRSERNYIMETGPDQGDLFFPSVTHLSPYLSICLTYGRPVNLIYPRKL